MMAIFSKKKDQGPSPEEVAEQRRAERLRQEWQRLEHAISTNPLFAINTFDGLNWVEPFTGSIVPTPFGRDSVIRKHYAEHDHWRRGRTKSVPELERIRWLHWLKQHLREDDRLRIFNANGHWLNPHNGQWAEYTTREGSAVTPDTVKAMADDLATNNCPGPEAFQSLPHLKKLVGAQTEDEFLDPIIGDVGDNGQALRNQPEKTNNTQRYQTNGQARISKRRQSDHDTTLEDLRSLIRQQSSPAASITSASGAHQTFVTQADTERQEDLDKARKVQQNMLGKIPSIPDYTLAVHYEPYNEIGGDFYEVTMLDANRYLILIGDVTGHGVQAALVTSSMLKSLRYITKLESDLIEILTQLNDSAREDLVTGQFVTVWAGILDLTTNIMETVCAGHHPAILANLDKDVIIERIGHRGMAIGLASSTILRKNLHVVRYQLEPGDMIIQYTDGIAEMKHPEQGEFGDARVMGGTLFHLESGEPQQVIDGMATMASSWTGCDPDDDVTLLAFKLEPSQKNSDENAREPQA